MQPTLLKFFSRNNSTGSAEKRASASNNTPRLSQCNTHVSNGASEEQVCRFCYLRRILYDSSDEENIDDPVEPLDKLNGSSLAPDDTRPPHEGTNLSAFACSSPSVNRGKTPVTVHEASPKLRSKVSEALDNSVQNSFVDTDLEEATLWDHLSLPFLRPDKIMDAFHRRPDSDEYDPRTLFVPKEFMMKQSPGMRQWWELKTRYADVVLLFKVGKFYEMYHMDASIGVKELGLVYMRGSFAHCGFPEVAFPRMAHALVNKGYKVGRVEQTESVEAMTERTRGRPAHEKVVRREVCQLLTPGTCTATDRAEVSHLSQVENEFGVALLNAVNGMILLGQFADDGHHSRLRTIVYVSLIFNQNSSRVSKSVLILHFTACKSVTISDTQPYHSVFRSRLLITRGSRQIEDCQTTISSRMTVVGLEIKNRDMIYTEPGLENITFLYKFIPGACPKSYGFNAARLAHLPDKVRSCSFCNFENSDVGTVENKPTFRLPWLTFIKAILLSNYITYRYFRFLVN
ncbi:unnamed protein product [Echinostoma caproni]|uniref:MutS_I domain-containing protein n=1 Tax=Echinostoma caproni TaxID=27848 RepID=A0A183AQ74_9TREM|nr:unnamed protein product [Echinostoma caproni]